MLAGQTGSSFDDTASTWDDDSESWNVSHLFRRLKNALWLRFSHLLSISSACISFRADYLIIGMLLQIFISTLARISSTSHVESRTAFFHI